MAGLATAESLPFTVPVALSLRLLAPHANIREQTTAGKNTSSDRFIENLRFHRTFHDGMVEL